MACARAHESGRSSAGKAKPPGTNVRIERGITMDLVKTLTQQYMKPELCLLYTSFHFNQGNHDIKFFSCNNHNSGLRKCSSTHYIRLDFLEQVVLYEVHRLACFANEYENDFIKAMVGRSAKVAVSYTHLCRCAMLSDPPVIQAGRDYPGGGKPGRLRNGDALDKGQVCLFRRHPHRPPAHS